MPLLRKILVRNLPLLLSSRLHPLSLLNRIPSRADRRSAILSLNSGRVRMG